MGLVRRRMGWFAGRRVPGAVPRVLRSDRGTRGTGDRGVPLPDGQGAVSGAYAPGARSR